MYTVGSLVNLLTLNILCACLLIAFTISFTFLPESPEFLIRNSKTDEAAKSIKLLRGSNFNAELEISHLTAIFMEETRVSKSPAIVEIRKRETLKAFFIILFMFIFFQMSGIVAVTFYTTAIFIDAGVEMDPSTATIITGVVQCISTLAIAAFIDRLGRVFLLVSSFIVMIIGLSGVGFYFLIKDKSVAGDISWLPLMFLCTYVIGFSIGIGPIIFVLLSEFFSDNAKRIIAPFSQTLNFLMSFGVGILYPALVKSVGNGFTFAIFAAFCCAGLVFTIFLVPETKGKSLAEIQSLMKK